MSFSESPYEKLERLRIDLYDRQEALIEAEAHRADQLADVLAFEEEVERRVGRFVDELAEIENDLNDYNQRLNRLRNKASFGVSVDNVEEQFRRTWTKPPEKPSKPPVKPPKEIDEREVKRLYRKLARQFHPDMASNPEERAYRTEKMAAINSAYAARSVAELLALAEEIDEPSPLTKPQKKSEVQMIEALEEELRRIDKRLKEIRFELANLPNRQTVQLSLEVKIAKRQGRDLLGEMAADLQRKIAQKSAERDFLKSQFDQLGPQTRIGPK